MKRRGVTADRFENGARMLGRRMVWVMNPPERLAVTATRVDRPQVTVVVVQAGALVNFGGFDPRTIPATLHQRAAITATTITEGEQE